MTDKQFPLLLDYELRRKHPTFRRSVPWSFVEPHREQAMTNHYQTLERLAERGGLSPVELWMVVHHKEWGVVRADISEDGALTWLEEALAREPIIYTPFALKGNVVTLGGNLWNERVMRAINRKKEGEDPLECAAHVFFSEILPELHNFAEQKMKADLRAGSIASIRLIDHPEGRQAMKGWVVRDENGEQGVIEKIDGANQVSGTFVVTVYVYSLKKSVTYNAEQLRTL